MNNQTQQHITQWQEQNPALAQRGIDESTWGALNSTIYPGANPSSILLAVDYCRARGLDIMLKPVHLVPMNVKNSQTGQYEWRDVPMPGIGLYRIQAERSGTYAGADAPEFGPLITKRLGSIDVTFPEWCKYTVYKAIGDKIVKYSALEYWEENYASKGKEVTPNAMWAKRPRGQLAKCAEAQALRKAWPEIGQEPTAEEMEGKSFGAEKDITPQHGQASAALIKNNQEMGEIQSWINALGTISTEDEYNELRKDMTTHYKGMVPTEIKHRFGARLMELRNVNS